MGFCVKKTVQWTVFSKISEELSSSPDASSNLVTPITYLLGFADFLVIANPIILSV